MNRTKRIVLTGYRVKFVDLRSPKPRTICEDVYPLDKDSVAALARLDQDVTEFVTAQYRRRGYHVIDIERITPRRVVDLDLVQLWGTAGQDSEVTQE